MGRCFFGLAISAHQTFVLAASEFSADPKETDAIVKFISNNTIEEGLPQSYRAPKGYWKSIGSRPDDIGEIMERLLVGEEGSNEAGSVNIYDAATWQITMALTQQTKQADLWTQRLLSGSSGVLSSIKATSQYFTYNGVKLDADQAYFFRMFGNRYLMSDPLDGKDSFAGFPNSPQLHHEDWKPITGENAWAAIIGPLQTAYIKYKGVVPLNSPEAKLALSILPALKAMQSPLGAIYHAPEGTFDKDPREISNENNISVLAALRMLHQVARQNNNDLLTNEIAGMMEKIENYFKEYAFNKEAGVFYQGGKYTNGEFTPSKDFAVDCQTWGIVVLQSGWIDRQFGEGAAYKMWQQTKARAGCYENGILEGVGYTDGHDILSSDWSFGAVLMAKILSAQYKTSHPDWSEALAGDASRMREGIETLRSVLPNGEVSYKYSNKRYYVIFGWWANPIPSLAGSTWAYLIDRDFNPFILGG